MSQQPSSPFTVVTGAFGYSGRYITKRLLEQGQRVVTLTNSPDRPNPFGALVQSSPFSFDAPQRLVQTLSGADTLFNTYWIRFNHSSFSHQEAIDNTLTLFAAARQAGVKRIVHVSITNPSEDSPLEYFKGKARLEHALRESGIPHTILRPAVLFGQEDILINNIAWALRRFPFFGIFGDGQYRLQPIAVDDLAALAVQAGCASGNETINAIGPETFTYKGMVQAVASAIGLSRPLPRVSPELGYALSRIIGWSVRDVFLTRAEIRGLMEGLLCVDTPPTGQTVLTEWMAAHASTLGMHYASELKRRRDRVTAYA